MKGRYKKVAEVKVRGDISFRLGEPCVYNLREKSQW